MLPRHARYILSRLRRSLLLSSYPSRIGRIENPNCSAYEHLSSHSALSSYGLFAPLALWRLSVSLRPLVQALGSCPDCGALWSSAMPPSLGRGQVTIPSFYVTSCLLACFLLSCCLLVRPSDKNRLSIW